jgi:virginiamycin B lyase
VPGGDVYFTEPGRNAIGRLDPATGAETEFDAPTSPGDPLDIVLGPDGALWFTDENNSRVSRMTLEGVFTEYDLAPGSVPLRIVAGPDGALWFTELRVGSVARITTDGVLTQYAIGSSPVGITAGRDGMLYVALFGGQLVRVNTQGEVTGSWDLPGSAFQVGRGSGREIWVTDYYGRHVYRVTPYAKS